MMTQGRARSPGARFPCVNMNAKDSENLSTFVLTSGALHGANDAAEGEMNQIPDGDNWAVERPPFLCLAAMMPETGSRLQAKTC